MQVCKGDIARIPDVERQGESALAALFFRLERIDLPVGSMVQDYFVANVMLARKFVNSSFRGSIRDIEAGLCERAGGPDADESAAAGDPQAGILSVPAAIQIGIGAMGVVIDLAPRFGALCCT